MLSRRRLLANAAAVTATMTAGCLADSPINGTDTTTVVPSLDDGDRMRATASAISVEQELSLDDNEVYIKSSDTIRYPATKSGGNRSSYGYISVEEWTTLEGMFVAKRAIREHLGAQLQSREWIEVSGTERGGPETEMNVAHLTYENDGEPDDEPAVSAGKLVTTTPRTVNVTVQFTDETATGSYPVFVVKWVGEHMVNG